MQPSELSSVLQASIAPVTLISGVGLLLLSMTNRLGRSIDRARSLSEEVQKAPDEKSARSSRIQLDIIHRRAVDLRLSVIFSVLSIFFVALLIVGLFGVNALGLPLDTAILVLFVSSLLCLVVSLAYFLKDITLALKALKLEISDKP